jgi:hypothetical protein
MKPATRTLINVRGTEVYTCDIFIDKCYKSYTIISHNPKLQKSEGIVYANKTNDNKEAVQDETPTQAKVTLSTNASLVSFIAR